MKDVGKTAVALLLGIVLVLASVSCGGGIAQNEYDRVLMELGEAQDEIATLESDLAAAKLEVTEGIKSSSEYQELLNEYNSTTAELESVNTEYDTLNTEHELLQTQHETLQSQNESNLNQINLLQTENTQLQAQIDELTPPFPEIAPVDLEDAIFEKINEARSIAGLDVLQPGKHLIDFTRSNSLAMSVAKQKVIYDDNWVPYQQHFIAGGYNTLTDIVEATMLIWKSNILSYNNNVLADDVIYGAVGVVESGGIFYITYIASDYP